MKTIQSILYTLFQKIGSDIVRNKRYKSQKEFQSLDKQEEVFLFI